MAKATFNQVNLVSGAPEAALAFYRLLGVDIPDEAVFRSGLEILHISGPNESGIEPDFDIDSPSFAMSWIKNWKGRRDLAGKVVVGFKVQSRQIVDEIHAELIGARHPSLQPPFDAFWGARYAVVEDPDGIAVGIMSPISAEFRSRPPS